jgi:hypothetical protein
VIGIVRPVRSSLMLRSGEMLFLYGRVADAEAAS